MAFSAGVAHARTFSNAYVSFELPEKWNCVLEQTEWVCRPTDKDLEQKGIIILTAKEVGPSDTLPAYKEHLTQPRVIASRTGQPLNSIVKIIDIRNIEGQPWVDGMHESSEVPNYYTRYLATVKDKIAILVTFSAHKLYYTKFNDTFFNAIRSLRVTATKSLMAGRGGEGGGGAAGGMFGSGSSQYAMDGMLPEEQGPGEGGGGKMSQKTKTVLALAAILAVVGIYLLIKRSKQKS